MESQHILELVQSNQDHECFGRLLYKRDRANRKVLHYSIQLNDKESLAWEPRSSGSMKGRGHIDTWKIKWEHDRPAKYVKHLSKEQIIKGIKISTKVFHNNWEYHLFRFNCEHWARLVTVGDCRCYQIKEFKKLKKIPVIGLGVVGVTGMATGAWEHNGYAQEITNSFININYNQLREYLIAQDWKKADEETFRLLLALVGRAKKGSLKDKYLNRFFIEDLRTIDQLWVQHSNGDFGFSVQKLLYEGLGGTPSFESKIWDSFGNRVGWLVNQKRIRYGNVIFSSDAPPGHLPARCWDAWNDGGVGSFSALAPKLAIFDL